MLRRPLRRARPTDAPPIRASASPSGSPGSLGLLFGHGRLPPPAIDAGRVLVAVTDEASWPASTAVATALRARGIACEVAPKADKFGKQIRYADRRHTLRLVPACDDGDQVKDIRSGDQVAADPPRGHHRRRTCAPNVPLVPPGRLSRFLCRGGFALNGAGTALDVEDALHIAHRIEHVFEMGRIAHLEHEGRTATRRLVVCTWAPRCSRHCPTAPG